MNRTFLGIFAYPDDESFGPGGALARCAAEGIDVHVLTTTDGAAGKVDPALIEGLPGADDGERLAGLRTQELEAACRALGVSSHRLTYRDSGMAGSPDNQNPECLIQADKQAVAEDIAALIDRLQPQVVVTHDPRRAVELSDRALILHRGEIVARPSKSGSGDESPDRGPVEGDPFDVDSLRAMLTSVSRPAAEDAA